MDNLTDKTQAYYEAWIHDVFIFGGLLSKDKAKRPDAYGYSYMYNLAPPDQRFKEAATTICDAVKRRKVDYKIFEKVDEACDLLRDVLFWPDLKTAGPTKTLRDLGLYGQDIIAWFCSKFGIVWPTNNVSKYELEAIVNDTNFGLSLEIAECYSVTLAQFNAKKASKQAAANNTAQTATQATAAQPANTTATQPAASTAAANATGYKASGGHAKEVTVLLNGNKVALSGPIFCIEADKIGKNTPNAFIAPLRVSGPKGSIVKVAQGAEAKAVNFGSGNGYADCKLWFNTALSADAMLLELKNKFGSKFTNIHVSKIMKADPNGYFEVVTEFGNAYIVASKLNEDLAAEEVVETPKQKPDRYGIYFEDVEEFTKNFLKGF